MQPTPATPVFTGTMLLGWDDIIGRWEGRASSPEAFFYAELEYNLFTGIAYVDSEFQIGPWRENGAWETLHAGPWPTMFYLSRNVSTSLDRWIGTVLVTG